MIYHPISMIRSLLISQLSSQSYVHVALKVVLVGCCIISWGDYAFSNSSLTVNDSINQRVSRVPVKSFESHIYVQASALENLFKANHGESLLAQSHMLTFDNHSIIYQVGSTIFFIDQMIYRMNAAVREVDGMIYIPLDLLLLAYPAMWRCVIEYSEVDHRLTVSSMKQSASGDESELGHPSSPTPTPRGQPGRRLRSITLDPGHGGKDSGAIGPGGLKEKDVVLTIAILLREELKRKFGIDVFLTREDDTYLTLENRTAIANNNHSDIFISIHTNSGRRKKASGFEVYYLNRQPSDDEAMETAALENYGELTSENQKNVNQDVQIILWDLLQNKYLEESSILAEKILDKYEIIFNQVSRGVKQAPFMVLIGAEMPAVLVEVDFISNPIQEKQLMNQKYLEKIGNALVQGIADFKKHYEKVLGGLSTKQDNDH